MLFWIYIPLSISLRHFLLFPCMLKYLVFKKKKKKTFIYKKKRKKQINSALKYTVPQGHLVRLYLSYIQ